jgi:hypothetical protein
MDVKMKRMLAAAAVLAAAATVLVGAPPAHAAKPAPRPALSGLPQRAQELTQKGTASGGQKSLAAAGCRATIGTPFLSGTLVRVVAVVSCTEQMEYIEMNTGVYRGLNPPAVSNNWTTDSSALIGVVGTPCPKGTTDNYLGAVEFVAVTYGGGVIYQPPIAGPGPVPIFCP